jgi:hypothetical protein
VWLAAGNLRRAFFDRRLHASPWSSNLAIWYRTSQFAICA